MVICSYNDHVRLLSSEPLVGLRHQSLLGSLGADIVMESLHSQRGSECKRLISTVIAIRKEFGIMNRVEFVGYVGSSLFSRQRVIDCSQKLGRRQVAVRFDVMNNQHRRSKYKPFVGHPNLAIT